LQAGWANRLADGIDIDSLKTTLRTLETLHGRLKSGLKGEV
jgi:hypothetical protein